MPRHLLSICFFSLVLVFFTSALSAQNVSSGYDVSSVCSRVKGSISRYDDQSARSGVTSSYDVTFYFLDIEASNATSFVKGKTSMKALSKADMDHVDVDLSNLLQVDSVFLDGVKLESWSHEANVLTIFSLVAENDFFTTTIYYQGDGATTGFFSGISSDGLRTWTLSEPYHANDWFPCKQILEDKADSAFIYITVPKPMRAGSNGLLKQVVDVGDNKNRYEWETRYPIAYYLISMTIADYDEYVTEAQVDGHGVPVQSYLYKGTLDANKAALDQVSTMIEVLSELYSPYPFLKEKYGHCQAPLGGGAMEHQTMTTITNFEFNVIAHELGHQWFGDNVTCSSWQDIWVNEGFARYTEYLIHEAMISKTSADQQLKGWHNNVLSQNIGSVYVPAKDTLNEGRIFNPRLTYNKGASLLHMIRNIVDDDDVFFQTLKTYQNEFRGKVASGEDFKNILQTISGRDFTDFFNEWYYGQGHPIYNIQWNFDKDTLYINQVQTTSSTLTPFFHLPIDYMVKFSDGTGDTIRLMTASPDTVFRIKFDKGVTQISLDPMGWALKKVNGIVKSSSLKYITGVEEFAPRHFDVYPNPAAHSVRIQPKTDGSSYRLRLVTLQGKVIYDLSAHSTIDLPVSNLSPGIYLVESRTAKHAEFQKLQIAR